ncbi:MAG: hypothetical protein Ct9H300mP25_01980 [Acidobacteriota bacterium]|nr:MAG: hypothetical protein Ct9H300mP25_01980 [Acidobacteriota bacterium]
MPQLVSATPFWLASYYQEPEIMQTLLDGGADPTLTTLELWRPVFERAGAVGPPHIAGGFQTALQALPVEGMTGDETASALMQIATRTRMSASR